MAEKKEWTKDEIYSLISHWELCPELWDANHKEYRNKPKKQSTLKVLSALFGTNEIEIQRKLHNLRTQYSQEIRKLAAKRSGDEKDDVREPSWAFFAAMSFISPNHTSSKTASYEEVTENGGADPQVEVDDAVETSETVPRWKKKMKIQQREKEDECLKKTLHITDEPTDEFQIFGDFVASEIRNLNSRENRNALKRKILQAILEISEKDDSLNRGQKSSSLTSSGHIDSTFLLCSE